MSTMVMEAPPNGRATKEAMREVLDEREAERSLGDRIRALPRKAREWVGSTFRFLRLEGASGRLRSAWERVREPLSRVLGPIRAIGWFNLLGAALTCQKGRNIIRKSAGFTGKIITWPFRIAGRALGWAGRKVGLGGIVDEVEFQYMRAEAWVINRFNDGMNWLDAHEHHGAMRWGRSVYQLNVGGKLIRRYAPENLRTPLWIAYLFVPNMGVGPAGDTESRLSVVKDTMDSGEPRDTHAKKADPVADETVVTLETESKTKVTNGKAETEVTETLTHTKVERIEGKRLDTGKKVKIQKTTKPNGDVFYKMNGQTYTQAQLNEQVEMIEKLTKSSPAAPVPNRAARRAGADKLVPPAAQA